MLIYKKDGLLNTSSNTTAGGGEVSLIGLEEGPRGGRSGVRREGGSN